MRFLGLRDVSFPGVRRKLVDVEVDRALDRETLIDEARQALAEVAKYGPVSYTHLTLPTN